MRSTEHVGHRPETWAGHQKAASEQVETQTRRSKRLAHLGAGARGRRIVTVACALATVSMLASPSAGAERAPVKLSTALLAETSSAIRRSDVPGTAWSIDKSTGKVIVRVDSTVTAAGITKIKKAAGAHADAVDIKYFKGKLSRLLNGGQAIRAGVSSGTAICSLGFNVRRGTERFALTAGHCTKGTTNWYGDPAMTNKIGTTAHTEFPTNDWGVIRYDSDSAAHAYGQVYLYKLIEFRDISSAGNAKLGQEILQSGQTTGLRRGVVTGLDVTANYGNGEIVSGLVQTTACGEPGDSGGPVFAGNTALGLVSGGIGDCNNGGVTIYQPVTEVLSRHGMEVY
ncbi:S1 family peptidase [Streptomyces zaomyceticus]|uniref:S1 family peptidase n=1 Tax=Streptomyces zaomyceticus TaxID=68286 RepID=UPI00367C4A8E